MKALDLFCGGGGAALGMIAAGFDVVGVDIERRHARIYPGDFICGDATRPPVDLADFDLVWASPPCQRFSLASMVRGNAHRLQHPDLIPEIRALVAGHPWTVIENVPPAPMGRLVANMARLPPAGRDHRMALGQAHRRGDGGQPVRSGAQVGLVAGRAPAAGPPADAGAGVEDSCRPDA